MISVGLPHQGQSIVAVSYISVGSRGEPLASDALGTSGALVSQHEGLRIVSLLPKSFEPSIDLLLGRAWLTRQDLAPATTRRPDESIVAPVGYRNEPIPAQAVIGCGAANTMTLEKIR